MDYKKEIVKKIQSISSGYSVYTIFEDWVEMTAYTLSNQVDVLNKEEREQNYLTIVRKYKTSELDTFAELTALLVAALEDTMEDVLGWVYMHLEISSKKLGQFFTPYHLCQLMADVTNCEIPEVGRIKVNEPSCGAGGNIIAFAEKLKKEGVNYQEKMVAICQDLDWKAIYMCYVQMFLLGIPAKVIQGDTLKNSTPDNSKVFYTFNY